MFPNALTEPTPKRIRKMFTPNLWQLQFEGICWKFPEYEQNMRKIWNQYDEILRDLWEKWEKLNVSNLKKIWSIVKENLQETRGNIKINLN